MYIFGYGSLLNETSLRKTSKDARVLGFAYLQGYQRKLNAMCDQFPDVAMNVVKNKHMSVWGTVVDFPESDMEALYRREVGYELVDITKSLDTTYNEPVYCFIAPDSSDYRDKKAYRTYLDTCLSGVPEDKRSQWLKETIIECAILEDTDKPLYKPLD